MGQSIFDLSELRVNDKPYRVTGPIAPTLMAQWPGKVLTGAVTADSHPLLSSWGVNVSNGQSAFKHLPGETPLHSFVSTAETRYEGIMRRPRQVSASGFGAGNTTDTFNRADGALGNTDGATTYAWATSGSYGQGIFSEEAWALSLTAGNFAYAYIPFAATDVTVAVEVDTIGTGGGVVARWADANNFLSAFINGGDSLLYVKKMVGGVMSDVTGSPVAGTRSNGDTVTMSVLGDTVTVYVNLTAVLTYTITDAGLRTGTNHGMVWYNGATCQLDNFALSNYTAVQMIGGVTQDYSTAGSRRAYFFLSDRRVAVDNTSTGTSVLTMLPTTTVLFDSIPTSSAQMMNGTTQTLFVTTGSSIYRTTLGATWTQDTQNALFAVVYDGDLWVIEETGALWQSNDPYATPMTWVGGALRGTLPDIDGTYRSITSMFVAKDETGAPAIYVTTTDSLWKWDEANDKFAGPLFQWPRHPHGGRGSIEYPDGDDAIFIPVGLTVYKYVPGVPASVSNVSPQRLGTLPKEVNGAITRLVRTPQFLAAIITNDGVSTSTVPLLLAYTGYTSNPDVPPGWHTIGVTAVTPSTSVRRSEAVYIDAWDTFRLYYTFKDDPTLYYQTLYTGIHNPRTNPSAAYDTTAQYVYTGWFPGPRASQTKLAMRLLTRSAGCSANNYAEIAYQTDTTLGITDSWTTLTNTAYSDGQIDGNGSTVFYFGTNNVGVEFEYIRFRIGVLPGASPSTSTTPILEYIELDYMPEMEPAYSYAAELDLTTEYKGRPSQTMWEELKALAEPGALFPVMMNGATIYCRILNMDGQQYLGDERGRIQVTFVQPIT